MLFLRDNGASTGAIALSIDRSLSGEVAVTVSTSSGLAIARSLSGAITTIMSLSGRLTRRYKDTYPEGDVYARARNTDDYGQPRGRASSGVGAVVGRGRRTR